jgi:YesN/AraC family two-component response regulator
MPVSEIAQAVGMTNTSYFYTLFKKTFGTTPKDYRTNVDLTLNPAEEVVGS